MCYILKLAAFEALKYHRFDTLKSTTVRHEWFSVGASRREKKLLDRRSLARLKKNDRHTA